MRPIRDRIKFAETMTRIEFGGFTVRVWRHDPTPDKDDRTEEEQFVWEHLLHRSPETYDPPGIAALLLDLSRVSAVEVVDEHGNGKVYYTDW